MTARVWLVRTALDYVVVYRKPPIRDADQQWSFLGRIHVFSPRDAAAIGFLPGLSVDVPMRCQLSSEAPGPWWFIHGGDRVRMTDAAGTDLQPFCLKFLSSVGVAELPIGGSLSLRYED